MRLPWSAEALLPPFLGRGLPATALRRLLQSVLRRGPQRRRQAAALQAEFACSVVFFEEIIIRGGRSFFVGRPRPEVIVQREEFFCELAQVAGVSIEFPSRNQADVKAAPFPLTGARPFTVWMRCSETSSC